MTDIDVDGAVQWSVGLRALTNVNIIGGGIVLPQFHRLGETLTQSISHEFSGELRWRGDMESQARDNYTAAKDKLEIGEDAHHGQFIRRGTDPWYKGTFGEMMQALRAGRRVKFPWGVYQWAKTKKGMDTLSAYYMGWYIMTHGMGRVPASPIRRRYPSGKRGFDYPNYLINQKNRRDITITINDLHAGMVGLAYVGF